MKPEPEPEPEPEPSSSSPKAPPKPPAIAIFSLCLCVFISSLNTINFASALPAVATSLSATTTNAFWCGTVLLLSQCIAQPIYSALAEVLGRKPCLLFALALCMFGSLLSALAQNVGWLIGGRAVQGIGDGGINVCVNVMIVDLVPRRERARLSGIVSLAGAVGLVAGVLSGSGLAQVQWRLVFWVNIPITVVAFVIIVFWLKLKHDRGDLVERLKGVDWTGIMLVSGAIAGIIFAIVSGGTVYPWASVHILAPLIIGFAGVICFLLFEEYIAGRHGLGAAFIPFRLFSNRTSAFGYLITFLQAMVLWAISYYFLFYLHISSSKTLIQSSILFLPSTLLIPPSAAVAGILMTRFSHFKYFNVLAYLLLLGGCAGLSTLRADPTTGQILGFQFLYSLGGGILFPGRLVAVQAAQRERRNGDEVDVRTATGLVSFVTSLGQAFGIAMGSTALQNAWDPLVERALADGLLGPANGTTYFLPGSRAAKSADLILEFPPAVAKVYREIAAESIARVWYVCVGLAGLGVLAALGSRNLNLDNRTTDGEETEAEKV